MKKILYWALSFSPLPYLVRYLVTLKRPRFLVQMIIKKYFLEKLKVNISEAQLPLSEYSTVLDFFTRKLKSQVRPIKQNFRTVISPVDGTVMNYGQIERGELVQIKSITYTLDELVGKDLIEGFQGGSYITLYLSPRDYHRIHHPVGGEVDRVVAYPGRLFPVNFFSLENFQEVFTRNRRVVVCYNTQKKSKKKSPKNFDKQFNSKKLSKEFQYLSCLSCWVGALNVGRMPIYFDENFYQIESQTHDFRKRLDRSYHSLSIIQGEEAGCFELGSTVILIFPPHALRWLPTVSNNTFFRVGEHIAYIL